MHGDAVSLTESLTSPKVWLFGLMYFGVVIGLYGFTLWLPQILKGFGHLTNLQVGLLTAVPYVLAAVAMLVWAAHSDATNERVWHFSVAAGIGGAALTASGYLGGEPVLAFIALTLAACGIYAVLPVFWTIPTTVLRGTAAAGGIALINMVGNIGGYVGPAFIGYIRDQTQSFSYGLLLIGGFAILSAALAPVLGRRFRTQPSAPGPAR